MKTAPGLTLLLLLTGALAACTSTGTGGGQLMGEGVQEQAVTFHWKSVDGGISGTMTAALPDAVYQGRFFQITEQTRDEILTPLWLHWDRGWNDWPDWNRSFQPLIPTTRFVTHYTGKVVATLESDGGQRLRCRFHLVAPVQGMSGGGEGECQLNRGRMVRAVFESN